MPKVWSRSGVRRCWRRKSCAARPEATDIIRNCSAFRKQKIRPQSLAAYLKAVHEESVRRGYNFDGSKIGARHARGKIRETRGQLLYEWSHLKRKLKQRDPKRHREFASVKIPTPHPLFKIVPGKVRAWEKVK